MTRLLRCPRPRVLFAFATTLALLPLAARAASPPMGGGTSGSPGTPPTRVQSPSNQLVRQHYVGVQCLRVTAAGVRLRNAAGIAPPTTGGPITLGMPAGSVVVWAGLYWSTLGNAPPLNAVKLNGSPVGPVPLPVTASPCWPEPYAFPYYADVTPFVVNGVNVAAGFDDSGIPGTGPETEGASLVVIYGSSDGTEATEIIVTDGNDLGSVGGLVIDNLLPVVSPPGLPATLTFIGGDGQVSYPDDQMWNGAPLGNGDDWNGSDPSPVLTNEGWDTDSWPVLSVPPYDAGTSFPVADMDCVNWIATVLEVGVTHACAATPAKPPTWGQIKLRYR
jgi:hypothetical protein